VLSSVKNISFRLLHPNDDIRKNPRNLSVNVRKLILIVKLCLPRGLKICLISQLSLENEHMCIILSLYIKWSQKARFSWIAPALHVLHVWAWI
jgi:hypothetical protein